MNRLALLLLFTTLSASAQIKLSTIFSDHAVLQRNQPIPIWGSANPGDTVHVQLASQTLQTTANPHGNWKVALQPLPAGGPYDLTVTTTGTTPDKVTIHDLLIGEVWLASGQSNMAFPVSGVVNAAQELSAADHPQLRMFVEPDNPLPDPTIALPGTWLVSTPTNARRFTAVGYFFALSLLNDLHVPIGIISASVGATPAESWTPFPLLQADPLFSAAAVKELELVRTAVANPSSQALPDKFRATQQSSTLYNGEIFPLENYALRGVIWYQGEDNANKPDRALNYPALMNHLISGWRDQFHKPDLPFYLAQLVNYDGSRHNWEMLRDSQVKITQTIPNTALAVGIDVGESDQIHPRNKRPIGERLALLARHRVYGEPIEDSGPTFDSLTISGNQATVHFTHAGGLHATADTIPNVTIAGADQHFVPATATISGTTLIVSSPDVPKPVAVRYAFSQDPEGCDLYNASNLPMGPFRTDTWPLKPMK